MSWTTQDLISTIKNREMFPDISTGSLSDPVLLQFATEELYITLLPVITGVREKFYETFYTSSYSDVTTSLPIPERSIGNGVTGVQYIYGMSIRTLNPIDPTSITSIQPNNWPNNYYFQNNDIVFYPPPNGAAGSVVIRYLQRPSRLAQVSDCTQVTSFDVMTGVVNCVPPTTWTTSDFFDFIPNLPARATPFGLDTSVTDIQPTSITFTSLPVGLAIGDWIALANYTPIPEIPFEFQSILAQATAVRALGAINDVAALANAKQDLVAGLTGAVKLMTTRDEGGRKIVVANWRSF